MSPNLLLVDERQCGSKVHLKISLKLRGRHFGAIFAAITQSRSDFSWGSADVTSRRTVNGDSSQKIADKLHQNSEGSKQNRHLFI